MRKRMKEASQAIYPISCLNNIWWKKSSLLQISDLHWARILNERPGVGGDNAEHLVSLTDSRPLTGSERSIVHPDHPLASYTDEEINKSFEKPNYLWSNFVWAVSSWWLSRSKWSTRQRCSSQVLPSNMVQRRARTEIGRDWESLDTLSQDSVEANFETWECCYNFGYSGTCKSSGQDWVEMIPTTNSGHVVPSTERWTVSIERHFLQH